MGLRLAFSIASPHFGESQHQGQNSDEKRYALIIGFRFCRLSTRHSIPPRIVLEHITRELLSASFAVLNGRSGVFL
jgi:hypothetical protein